MDPYRKSVLAAIVFLLAPLVNVPAMGQSGNAGFAAMRAETGCDSKYSDEKKADLFEAKPPRTFSYDVRVKLSDPKSAYDLQKDQRVTLRFTVRSAGGCVLPYGGDQGVLVP